MINLRFVRSIPRKVRRCVTLSLIAFFILCFWFLENESDRYETKSFSENFTDYLCVIVPFKDRFEELLEFVPHINVFLQNQKIAHDIFVINQIDNYRFNRGSLINVGYNVVKSSDKKCSYIAIHDVDLLPLNSNLSYSRPVSGVYHLAAPHLHPRYHYSTFLGGIILIELNDYYKVNGMSNKYWGWGTEDDDFYLRLKFGSIKINRPGNLSTGMVNTFRHIHDGKKRKRDMEKCYNQRNATRKRDKQTGLSDTEYRIESKHNLVIDNVPLVIVNVKLNCNHTFTPWCKCH